MKVLKLSVGLDAKYGLTNNLTLDVTLNTDFAQVEADDEQINLTRFSLFFPEKRTFFQERASIFNFGFEGRYKLVLQPPDWPEQRRTGSYPWRGKDYRHGRKMGHRLSRPADTIL